MRSIKSTGVLTRGRGVSEAQHQQCVLSMSAGFEVNLAKVAMQAFTGVNFTIGLQHKDIANARLLRDSMDINAEPVRKKSFLRGPNPS